MTAKDNKSLSSQVDIAKARLQHVLEASGDGFFDWPDLNTSQMWWSDKLYRMLAFEPGTVVPSYELLFGQPMLVEDRARFKKLLMEQGEDDGLVKLRVRLRDSRKTNSIEWRWYSLRASFYHDANTGHRGLAGSLRNVQELHELEIAQRQGQIEAQRFAANAAHDMKDPLQTMVLYGGLIKMRTAEIADEQLEQFADRIVARGEQMIELIDGLGALARVDRQLGDTVVCDLNKLLETVCQRLSELINQRGAQVQIAANLPVIKGHPVLISNAVQNLIANAIKFQPGEVPKVEVTCESVAGSVDITVRDHGIGIEKKYLERIFKPLERLHSRDDYPGDGLGLATVTRIMAIHGGMVGVESTVGEGSTFLLSFPYSG